MIFDKEYLIKTSNDNIDILMVKDEKKFVYLGSKYNEVNNIKRFINNIKLEDGESIIIIIGLSLGQFLDELINLIGEYNKIIIIEPDKNIYNYNLNNNYICNKLEENNITYILYKEKVILKEILEKLIDNSYIPVINISTYTNYEKIYLNECDKIVSCINEYIDYIKLSRNSNLLLKDSIIKNYIENLIKLEDYISVGTFKDLFKDKTAIIVSSGPSLHKNIENIKKYTEHVVIISVIRSMNELEYYNIEPDFICVLDPIDKMSKLMKKHMKKNIPIICTEQSNSDLLKEYKGKKIIALNAFRETIRTFNEKEYISLPEGGSVAHLATSFAVNLGVKNIIFIGQDLAFTNMELHSKLSSDESVLNLQQKINSNDIFYVEGNKEEYVPTNSSLNSFKNWFETLIINNKLINFINATEGGARIHGTKIMNLFDALKEYSIEVPDKHKKIEEILKISKETKKENIRIRILEELNYLKDITYKGVKLSEKLLDYYIYNKDTDICKIIKELDSIDIRINKFKEIKNFINFVAYDNLETIELGKEFRVPIKEKELDKYIRISNRNIRTYDAYYKAIIELIRYIEQGES